MVVSHSPEQVLKLLVESLKESVLTDLETLAEVRSDKSGKTSSSNPICVVEARSTEDVVQVMRIASLTKTPVVTRGGGSGLAGGAIGSEGDIVLSLRKMDQILEISVPNRWALVQAGVINQDLNLAAQELGLWFAPDPASRIWSTVGGNIATNAGGLLCAKYGVTKEAVRQLTVVLADGQILEIGHETVKGVTGYDLVSLFVGSEGTLGVITQARVALKPLDHHPVWTISATTSDIRTAGDAVQETLRQGMVPSVFELIDQRCSRYIASHLGLEIEPNDGNRLIAQTDGPGSEQQAREIAKVWEKLGLTVELETGREDLLNFRRAMLPALSAHGNVLIEDVAVPISELSKMLVAIREIEIEFGLEIPTVAHAGDGNLHPNFIYTGDEVPAQIWKAADAIFRTAISLGGTLTGEHGVGLLKRQWLMDELGPTQWQLQWGIKNLFDPDNILNPGKVFDPVHLAN